MATEHTIEQTIRLLLAAGYTCTDPRACADVWAAVMSDLTDDELAQGALAFMRQGEAYGWPKPPDIRRHVPRLAATTRAEAIDTTADDWGTVRQLIQRRRTVPDGRGGWRLEDLGQRPEVTPAIRAGVRACGGWDAIGDLDERGRQGAWHRFRAAHRACTEGAAAVETYPQLTEEDAGRVLRLVDEARGDRR